MLQIINLPVAPVLGQKKRNHSSGMNPNLTGAGSMGRFGRGTLLEATAVVWIPQEATAFSCEETVK